MTELTKVSPEEITRREQFLREHIIPYSLNDPFSWSYAGKAAAVIFGANFGLGYLYNYFHKKPWYYALWMRLGALVLSTSMAYGVGSLRGYHYKTRDAVLEHYKQLHPQDFIRASDIYGRPYKDIILPWYPIRDQYFNMEKLKPIRKEIEKTTS